MKVIEYLKKHSIEKLCQEYYIRVKYYDKLIVLNYSQWSTRLKFNDIIKECRGLILDRYNFNVVSRSFDRFYNYCELVQEQKRKGGSEKEVKDYIDFKNCRVTEKIDGSLIKIYHFDNQWHVSTRGTAFAEFPVDNDKNAKTNSFRDLVFKTLELRDNDDFQKFCNSKYFSSDSTFEFNKDYTYIFEITTPQNKIVTDYKGKYILWFLAVRKNDSEGKYMKLPYAFNFGNNVKFPLELAFNDLEQCIESVENLSNCEEGYVLSRTATKSTFPFEPICKIKSSKYVELHHTGGMKDLTLKQIIALILSGEYEEYYFTHLPEKKELFKPYVKKINAFFEENSKKYNLLNGSENFAQLVKREPCSWIMFRAHQLKSNDLLKVFQDCNNTNKKVNFLLKNINWSKIIL